MNLKRQCIFLIVLALFSCTTHAMQWIADAPCLAPGVAGTFDEVAVKDPTLVFHDNGWHVFYTARGAGSYTLGYTQAPTLAELNTSKRHRLKALSEKTDYAAAPQIFYFAPQNLWYLIYQTHGLKREKGRYTPMYVTMKTLADPTSWSAPKILVDKFERAKWIDFWVICDESTAYLFYTRDHKDMVYMTTPVGQFPAGFTKPKRVKDVEVHEAVCVYKIQDRNEYAMLVELNKDGHRSFELSKSQHLAGPWTEGVPFATGKDLKFPEGIPHWTDRVSHGEFLRSGVNQRLEIPPISQTRFLIQGTRTYDGKDYAEISWQLGLIKNFE